MVHRGQRGRLIEPVDIYAAGADAADAALGHLLGVEITKAKDPLDDRDFVAIVNRVAKRLVRVAAPTEERARTRAEAVLDVDWRKFGVGQRKEKLAEADAVLAGVPDQSLPGIEGVIRVSAGKMVSSTRARTIAKHKLHIYSTTEARHTETANVLTSQTGLFIRDNYGEVRKRLSAKARAIVADGIETGIGSKEISGRLADAMKGARRADSYWDLIAMTFSNRARTFTQIASFDEARIDSYRIVAVMDEVTSRICRYMNGRVFDVQAASKRIERVQQEKDPETIKRLMPWVEDGVSDNGQEFMFLEGLDGKKQIVAAVYDDGQRFGRGLKEGPLERAGCCVPPFHARCRTSIIPA